MNQASHSPEGLIATLAALAGGNTSQSAQLRVRTNTSAQVRSRLNSSAASTVLRCATLGWIDTRGRDA